MFIQHASHQTLSYVCAAGAAYAQDRDEGAGESLEDAARDERERLREELGREPNEDQISEWLRQQTEGY